MVEYASSQVDYTLNIDREYYNRLDIESFSLMMNLLILQKYMWQLKMAALEPREMSLMP